MSKGKGRPRKPARFRVPSQGNLGFSGATEADAEYVARRRVGRKMQRLAMATEPVPRGDKTEKPNE